MIKKIFNKNKGKNDGYLDLTTQDYLNSKRMLHSGFKQVLRPYKKIPLVIAVIIAALGIIPLLPFFITIPLAIKILMWFG